MAISYLALRWRLEEVVLILIHLLRRIHLVFVVLEFVSRFFGGQVEWLLIIFLIFGFIIEIFEELFVQIHI